MKSRNKTHPMFVIITLLVIVASFSLTACQRPSKVEVTPTTSLDIQDTLPDATNTPEPAPTVTTLPLAAIVNGEEIFLEDLNNEILRFMAANPGVSAQDSFAISLQSLIDLKLLSQAARNDNFAASDEDINTRINDLIQQLGDEAAFNQWLEENYYTPESFSRTLKTSIEAQVQTQQIANQIPDEMDQVELRQILVYDQATASAIESALENGTGFDWLAEQYHPLTKGYLSWTPRGYLTLPEIEEVVFELEIDQVSEAIKTDYGYHFIKVLNHEMHALSADAKQTLQLKAIEEWVEAQNAIAEIQIIATVQ